jgi:N-acetyl-1-D-myo-inositol-2-amino-2-deoxy-alpha-D-glucopyranoside deacetylase
VSSVSQPASRPRLGAPEIVVTAVGALLALVLGGGVGLVLTVTHTQWAPWGLVAGLAIVAALVVGMRLAFGRLAAVASALGVLLATALLTLPGAGGSVLVADGALGYIWAIGPTVVSVIAVSWPTPRPRPAHVPEPGATRP